MHQEPSQLARWSASSSSATHVETARGLIELPARHRPVAEADRGSAAAPPRADQERGAPGGRAPDGAGKTIACPGVRGMGVLPAAVDCTETGPLWPLLT